MKKLLIIVTLFFAVQIIIPEQIQTEAKAQHHMMHVLAGQSGSNGIDLLTGLVGVWELNETSGSTAYDGIGSNNGTISGALVNQTGLTNLTPCYYFDGSNDRVTIPSDLTLSCLRSDNDRSISFWVKVVTWGYNKGVISVGTSGTLTDFSIETETTEGRLTVNQWNGDFSFYMTGDFYGWHHVVYMYDDAANLTSAYIDGVLEGTRSNNLNTSTTNFYFGYATGHSTYSNVYLDQILVYDFPLSIEQIQAIYNSGDGLPYSSF